MDEEYIKIKIENCNYLIENANSPAQKIIYQGYLKFWKEKLDEKPPEIKKTVQDVKSISDFKFEIKLKSPKEPKPKEEPPEVDEVETIIEDLTEIQRAEEYIVKFPNRKAYYTREGKRYPTKLFQEFLKSEK